MLFVWCSSYSLCGARRALRVVLILLFLWCSSCSSSGPRSLCGALKVEDVCFGEVSAYKDTLATRQSENSAGSNLISLCTCEKVAENGGPGAVFGTCQTWMEG
jgi:hypothetical protein